MAESLPEPRHYHGAMDPFTAMFAAGAFQATGPTHDRTARKAADKAQSRTDELELRFQRALLVMEAMWSLVREKTALTDEDLTDRMLELDASDGKVDGNVRRAPVVCERCERPTSRRLPRCFYCGHPVAMDPFG